MAELGAVKCDFCGFVAEMVRGAGQNLKAPEMWFKIGYNIYVSSGGVSKISKSVEEIKTFDKKAQAMKDKIRKRLPTQHACPQCAQEKVAVDLSKALPGKTKTVFGEEREVK